MGARMGARMGAGWERGMRCLYTFCARDTTVSLHENSPPGGACGRFGAGAAQSP